MTTPNPTRYRVVVTAPGQERAFQRFELTELGARQIAAAQVKDAKEGTVARVYRVTEECIAEVKA